MTAEPAAGKRMVLGVGIVALVGLPFVLPDYVLHIAVQILLWAVIYTAWAVMGRFGLVSIGHGAFMGLGAYTSALLWNLYGITPWLGIPAGAALAGLAACLLVLQYDVHPFIGLTFGPITFMICVLGGLGNMLGGVIAAFLISQIIAIGGYYYSVELSEVFAFAFFIVMIMIRPQGLLAR